MRVVVPTIGALALLLLYEGLTTTRATGRGRRMRALDQLALEAGAPSLTSSRLVAISAGTAVAALFFVAALTSSLTIACVFGILGALAPFAYLRSRKERRRKRLREAWPDAIATLVSGVRAGMSLPETCAALTERGPSELRAGFDSFAATYRSTGSFTTALERLRLELSDPIADRVVVSLAIAHDVGGTDLVRILRTLAEFVREDLRVRKEIQSRWSWTVSAARVAAAAPWLVLLLVSTRPEAASAYNSSAGLLVIAGGAAATLLGYRLMLRAARLPDDPRLDS